MTIRFTLRRTLNDLHNLFKPFFANTADSTDLCPYFTDVKVNDRIFECVLRSHIIDIVDRFLHYVPIHRLYLSVKVAGK